MKIEFTELGDNLDHNGTTFHYGVVTHKGNPYDFSLCEMYDENSDSSSFELTVIECDEEDEIDVDLILEKLQQVKDIHNMSEEELLERVFGLEEELIDLKRGLEKGVWPHEENETYLCESEDFVYFRDEQYNASVMYRKCDNKKWVVEDVVDNELITDVVEGNIIKINPSFIYDYQEILKQNKDV